MICGVIKNYAIDHITNEVEPLIIIRETDDWVNARGSVIKTRLGEVEATIARMQSLWKTIALMNHRWFYLVSRDLQEYTQGRVPDGTNRFRIHMDQYATLLHGIVRVSVVLG